MKWSALPLRLVNTILAFCLALTMAIFPIAMPRAAAGEGHHGFAVQTDHVHSEAASSDCDEAALITMDHHAPDGGATHDADGAPCCSMACHAFQVSTVPSAFAPLAAPLPMALMRDEQIGDSRFIRIERPPRAI